MRDIRRPPVEITSRRVGLQLDHTVAVRQPTEQAAGDPLTEKP